MRALACVIRDLVDRLRIAHFHETQLRREFEDRRRQEHLDRLRVGIKDNALGLNVH
jgi:hypothetical protein